MKTIFASLILLTTFHLFSQTNHVSFPLYKDVLTEFFFKYTDDHIEKNQTLRFEKRPDGWHVIILENAHETERIIKDELFWNCKKRKYSRLSYPKNDRAISKKDIENKIDSYANQWVKYFIDFYTYYNYPGFEMDIINKFENQKNLPDSILYILAYAYSTHASNFFSNNTGFAIDSLMFDLSGGKNSLTDNQLAEYRFYRYKAIETFKKVALVNPEFETIVGNIYTRIANEHMVAFLDMRVYQNEDEANKELVDNQYSDFTIAMAKNFLNSCDSNTILITYGDNDTYPLLYIQAKYKIRTDIMVVNISLLNNADYVNSLRAKTLDAEGLPLSITPDEISDGKRGVIVVKENEFNAKMSVNDIISVIKDTNNVLIYGDQRYYHIPVNRIYIPYKDDEITWSIDRGYFYQNHLIILDILANNNWERPLYFTVTSSSDSYFGLEEYFEQTGITYQLVPKKNVDTNNIGYINTKKQYDFLMNKFDSLGLASAKTNEKLMCINYRLVFQWLSGELIERNEYDSARTVMNYCIDLMPDDKLPYGFFMLEIMKQYYSINDTLTGNDIAMKIIYNLNSNRSIYSDVKYVIRGTDDNQIINELNAILSEYYHEYLLNYLKEE